MKKLIALTGLLLLVTMSGIVPFPRSDVANLKPVQALVVSREGAEIVLNGGEVQGRGADWAQAMDDLRQSGSGRVFLGTAEQIILVQTAVRLLPQVLSDPSLRPAAQVCVTSQPVTDVQQAAEFLSAHETGVTIQKLRTVIGNAGGASLPVLAQTEGGLRIYAP